MSNLIETYGFNEGLLSLSIKTTNGESFKDVFITKALKDLGINYHYIIEDDYDNGRITLIWNIASADIVDYKDDIPTIYKRFVDEVDKESKAPLN